MRKRSGGKQKKPLEIFQRKYDFF